MIKHHPTPEFIAEYSSGTLPSAQTVSVTMHLQFCDRCQQIADSLTDIGGELLSRSEPCPVADNLLDNIFAAIDEPVELSPAAEPEARPEKSLSGIPPLLQQLLPVGGLNWRFLSPSLRAANLDVDERHNELALHRIQAGGKAPEHSHKGTEITVVLKGSFSDEDGVYQPGDFIVREPGDVHRPFAAMHEECICLSVLEAPIQLTGLNRIFNPFVRFSHGRL